LHSTGKNNDLYIKYVIATILNQDILYILREISKNTDKMKIFNAKYATMPIAKRIFAKMHTT
jgi:hypothetical protein